MYEMRSRLGNVGPVSNDTRVVDAARLVVCLLGRQADEGGRGNVFDLGQSAAGAPGALLRLVCQTNSRSGQAAPTH